MPSTVMKSRPPSRRALSHQNDGVSPVVGTVLVLGIFMIVSAGIVFVAQPQFTKVQEDAQFQTLTTDTARISNAHKTLAVVGSEGELKKPVITLPSSLSAIRFDEGHHVMVAAAYGTDDYTTGSVAAQANGTHFDLDVDAWEDLDRSFTVTNLGPDVGEVRFTTHRWNTIEWHQVATEDHGNGVTNLWDTDETLTLTIPAAYENLDDGTYRITIADIGGSDPETIGEVWFFEQTRLMIEFPGSSGLRSLFVENGALFRYEDGRYFQERAALVSPPDNVTGTSALTWRLGRWNTTIGTGSAGGGQGTVALLMDLKAREVWAKDRGAWVVRAEFEGPYANIWRNHLDLEGMRPAYGDHESVWFIRGGDTERTVFPFHFTYADIAAGVRSA